MQSSLVSLLVALSSWCLAASSCDRGSADRKERSARKELREDACRPAFAQKLGVPFVRVCPREPVEAGIPDPFWISAVPLSCGPGIHSEVTCLPVTPLGVRQESRGDSETIPPAVAAFIDVHVAHRLCTMRFAGRLPTRRERAQARSTAGLVALAVLATERHFEMREVAEWVTETSCENPSLIGDECGPGVFPTAERFEYETARLLSCTATSVRPTAVVQSVAPGEHCPAWAAGANLEGALPCAVREPFAPDLRSLARRFQLRCEAAAPNARAVSKAAVRCVVPESLLELEPH